MSAQPIVSGPAWLTRERGISRTICCSSRWSGLTSGLGMFCVCSAVVCSIGHTIGLCTRCDKVEKCRDSALSLLWPTVKVICDCSGYRRKSSRQCRDMPINTHNTPLVYSWVVCRRRNDGAGIGPGTSCVCRKIVSSIGRTIGLVSRCDRVEKVPCPWREWRL
jgi:hypothetical protein